MKTLSAEQIDDLINAPMAEKARVLLNTGRLWKFTDRLNETGDEGKTEGNWIPSGFAGAYVLGKAPEPYTVLWNGDEWSCECSSHRPCVHLSALLLRLSDTRPDDARLGPQVPENHSSLSESSELDFGLDPRTGPAFLR